MTEQEFRKLKQLDLIQILLTQGNEVAMQQGELDRRNERLGALLEENDIIKLKLNDRDAMTELIKQKLNESDERIRELEEEIKRLYADRRIELEEAGSLVQAALELNKIFEAAQKEAEQYIQDEGQEIERLTFDEASVPADHNEAEPLEIVVEQSEPEPPETVTEQPEAEPPEIVVEQSEPEYPETITEQSELEPEQSEAETEQSELEPEQSEPEPEQSEPEPSEAETEQSELEPKAPEPIFIQQTEYTAIEECCNEEASPIYAHSKEEKPTTGDKPAAEEKPTTEEKPAAEEKPETGDKPAAEEKPTTGEKPAAEEKPTTEGKPIEEENPTVKEASAVVKESKSARKPGRAKSRGLLGFLLKRKK